jgi:hypothetical protein
MRPDGRSRVYLHETNDTGLVVSMGGIDEYVLDAADKWHEGQAPPTVVRELLARSFDLGGRPEALEAD